MDTAVLSIVTRRILFSIAVLIALVARGATPTPNPSSTVDNFSLPNTQQQQTSLSSDPSIRFHVLCFLGTECPLAKIYGPRLQAISAEYADRGIAFIGVNSNIQDSMEELQRYVDEHGIQFPVVKDYDRSVALQAGATRTPEVVVIDRAGVIRYQGRIDDQYEVGIARKVAKKHDLRDAIDQLIADKEVTAPRTEAVGCLIALPRSQPSKSDVTFCNQVIRILQNHCIECHRDGEIGPFPLDQYDEVVGWADMSLEVIEEGRMPPWHASPDHGSFANSRYIPDADKQTLREWVDAGTPYGDADELPPKAEYVTGWRFSREPDLVLKMSDQAFEVPPDGTVEYQYFVVDPGFTEDKWIRSAQVIPGNSAVVHHCIAFTRPPDGSDFRETGLLAGYVPGQIRSKLPDGFAQRVPAGSRIVFQMHYTPTGTAESDLTRLGLIFADPKDVTHEVIALGGVEQEFEIPPGAKDHAVDGNIGWFPKDGLLLTILPHMHLRGKSFEFHLRSGDDTTTLLKVPAYDFNWQHIYELTEPLALDKIDQLAFSAVFDNSPDNPNNPDPTEYVTWGDQTWQEMAVTFISVARPLDRAPEKVSPADRERRKSARQRWEKEAMAFAKKYMARFDSNGDNFLTSHELPDSVRMFSFWEFDGNNDERLSLEEIQAQAYWRLQRNQ